MSVCFSKVQRAALKTSTLEHSMSECRGPSKWQHDSIVDRSGGLVSKVVAGFTHDAARVTQFVCSDTAAKTS